MRTRQPATTKRTKRDDVRAFTVRELLVVVLTLGLLTVTAVPAWLRASERALRLRCVSNLQQLGVGLQTYASDANEFVPICKYRDVNPTQYTYEVARTEGGNMQITQGYMNLGLLIRARYISDPQLLYCPAQRRSPWTYQYYVSASNGWFASPQGDTLIRAGYHYFPQSQAPQNLGNGLHLPRVITTTLALEYGSLGSTALQPMRFHEVNLEKSIVTDLVHGMDKLAHQGQAATGVNALFPDGRVTFQSERRNPANFSLQLWGNIISDGISFRQVMNGWKP